VDAQGIFSHIACLPSDVGYSRQNCTVGFMQDIWGGNEGHGGCKLENKTCLFQGQRESRIAKLADGYGLVLLALAVVLTCL